MITPYHLNSGHAFDYSIYKVNQYLRYSKIEYWEQIIVLDVTATVVSDTFISKTVTKAEDIVNSHYK